jgi:hypothetical protein
MKHDMRRGGSEARIERGDLESFAANFDEMLGEGDLWTTDGPTQAWKHTLAMSNSPLNRSP